MGCGKSGICRKQEVGGARLGQRAMINNPRDWTSLGWVGGWVGGWGLNSLLIRPVWIEFVVLLGAGKPPIGGSVWSVGSVLR